MENRTNVNQKIVNGRVVDSRVSSVSRQSGVSSVSSLQSYRNSGPNRPGTGNWQLNTAMSRGSFVKGAGMVVGSALAAGLGLGGVARAQTSYPDTVEVYPSGDLIEYPTTPGNYSKKYSKKYTIDILEIQSAVVGGSLEENWDVKEIFTNEYGQVTGQVPVLFPSEMLSARNPYNMEAYPENISGRTVLLKSTYSPGGNDHASFDFGTSHPWYADLLLIENPYPYEYPIKVSNVRFRDREDAINVNVDIIGEGSGPTKTTIQGGQQCFFACGQNNKFSPNYEYLGLDGIYAKMSIRNIRFENPSTAVYAYYNIDLTVDSCDIIGYQRPDKESSAFAIFAHTAGRFVVNNCVAIASDDAKFGVTELPIHYSGMPDFFWSFPTFDIGGAYVEITNNYVIGTYADSSLAGYPDVFYPPHHGIMAGDLLSEWYGREGSTAIIKDNWVAAEMGISCFGKYGTADQPTEVSGNHIVPSSIVAQQPRLSGLGLLPINRIPGAKSWGIQCFAGFPPDWELPTLLLNNAVIANNEIVMAGNLPEFGLQSFGIQLAGNNNYFQGNKITGNCDFGSYIMSGSSDIMSGSSGNQFIGNNTALLQTPWLYYFEDDACGNTVKGYTGGKIARVWNWECNDVSGVK